MRSNKFVKLLSIYVRNNYVIIAIVALVLFTLLFAFVKVSNTNGQQVYVKVKVGQGYWWAPTINPNIWYVNSIKVGDKQRSFTGEAVAEVVDVSRYPTFSGDQYFTYVTFRLRSSYNSETKSYTFNRSNLAVGSPIEITLPQTDLTGTVVEIRRRPFENQLVEKEITLINREGYMKDFPELYDQIQIGDSYNDGNEDVFVVTDKSLRENLMVVPNYLTGGLIEHSLDTRQDIIIRAKVKVQERDQSFVFGEDQILKVGGYIGVATEKYSYTNFRIVSID